jgi:crossover junction endodeoxyribonuclease RuvC
LVAVLDAHQPDTAAVEETFVNKNPTSTLKLGVARGVALLTPALHKLKVYEYPANLIKKSVVGAGHAGKEQVQMMVRVILPASQADSPDAADALAVAICHAHHMGTLDRWGAKDFREALR